MATIYWLGVDGDWTDASDWSGGVAPDAANNAQIGGSGDFTVTISTADAADYLTMDDANATIADSGTLTLGGVFSLEAGAFDLQTGTISGRGVTIASGASLNSEGADSVSVKSFANQGTVTVDGYDALSIQGAVSNAGTIAVAIGGRLAVDGSIANTGAITVTGGSAAMILGAGHSTLSGGGAVVLGGGSYATLTGSSASSSLTNVGNTISGEGRLGGVGPSGTGALMLTNQAGGVIDANGPTYALTIDATSVTNAGLIEATGAGALAFNGVNVANAGLIDVAGAGGMSLYHTVITNTGTVADTGAGTLTLKDSTITGGGLSLSSEGMLTSEGADALALSTFANLGTVTVDLYATLSIQGAVANGGVVDVDTTGRLALDGPIANSGTISLESRYNQTGLFLGAGASTLSGGGAVILAGGYGVITGSSVTSSLTNLDNTISGAGRVGETDQSTGSLILTNQAAGVIDASSATNALTIDATSLTNAGLIEATGAGGLTLNGVDVANSGRLEDVGTSGLTFYDTVVTNTGTVAQTGAGTLTLQDASLTNTGAGVLQALTVKGARILLGNGTISGGNLSVATGGTLASEGVDALDVPTFGNRGTVTVADYLSVQGKVTNVTTITVESGAAVALDGVITNSGKIVLNAGVNSQILTALLLGAGVSTLTGGGTVTLGAYALVTGNSASSALTNVNDVISGAGQLGGQDPRTATGALTLTNQAKGVIDATGASYLTIAMTSLTNAGLIETTGSGGLKIEGAVSNSATLLAGGVGALTLYGALVTDSSAGDILAAKGASLTLEAGATITGGAVSIAAGGELSQNDDGSGAAGAITGVTFSNAGAVDVGDYGSLLLSGRITNTGAIAVTNGALTLGGIIDNSSGVSLGSQGGSGAPASLDLAAGATTLTGAGDIATSDSQNNHLFYSAVAARLTNVNNTITGAGQLGSNYVTLVNDAGGVIDASQADNALDITAKSLTNAGLIETTGAGGMGIAAVMNNTGVVAASGAGISDLVAELTNSGTVEASSGASLFLGAVTQTARGKILSAKGGSVGLGVYEVTGGLVSIAAGGELSADRGSVIANATFSNYGTVAVAGYANALYLRADKVTNAGLINVAAGTLGLAGLVDNSGTIAVSAETHKYGEIQVGAKGVTLTGAGDIISTDGPGPLIYALDVAPGSTVVLTNVNNTISGEGTVGLGSFTLVNDAAGLIDATNANYYLSMKFNSLMNNGLIEATGAGRAWLFGDYGAVISNSGQIDDKGSGVMYIGNGAFYDPDFAMKSVTNSGLILSAGSGDLAIIGTTVMNTGTLAATGSGGITLRCASVDMEAGSQLSIGKGSSLTLDAGLLLAGLYSPGSSTLTVSGTVMNAGTIALYGRADNYNTPGAFLDIGAQGATLSGGGTVVMDPQSKHGSYDFIESAVAGAVLTNASNTISGAGQLGDGVLSLVNASQGVIDANNPNYALVLNTASAIANAGLIEASGGGEAQIIAAIANTGTLAANGGTLIAEGAVSGAGAAIIDGGTLDFGSAFSENVTFTGATGVLELAESQAYTGEVTGFSLTGATALDLGDIDFTKGATKASYSGTTTSGVLTVTDGTHTAHITLEGNYVSSTFTVSSDGHGGTKVVDPSRSPATGQLPASADVLIAAIATVGARAASLPHEAATNDIAGRTLLAPGRSVSLG